MATRNGPRLRTFLVECYAPRVTHDAAGLAAARGRRAVDEFGAAGGKAVYVGAYLVPLDELVMHVVRCADLAIARELAVTAGWSAERVVESTFLGDEALVSR